MLSLPVFGPYPDWLIWLHEFFIIHTIFYDLCLFLFSSLPDRCPHPSASRCLKFCKAVFVLLPFALWAGCFLLCLETPATVSPAEREWAPVSVLMPSTRHHLWGCAVLVGIRIAPVWSLLSQNHNSHFSWHNYYKTLFSASPEPVLWVPCLFTESSIMMDSSKQSSLLYIFLVQ